MAQAEPITTTKTWDELVLDAEVRRQVEEITQWQEHGMALFIGPMSLLHDTAALIAGGKGCPAYSVDLAKLVAKQAEDTKAHLDPIFDGAAREKAVLVVEGIEAMAQRGGGGRQRAYLLQRIQEYPGIVIVATNLHALADDAFARRFQAIVDFAGAEK
jgi:ATPase family associated with various cellular activities (AAA)